MPGGGTCLVLLGDDGRPEVTDGECFFTEFHGARLILESDVPFAAHGSVFLSTTRLVFVLRPPPAPRKPGPALGMPLAWIKPERLVLRKPFFDVPHISGTLVPKTDGFVSPVMSSRNSQDPPLLLAQPGKLVEFRVELLDNNDTELLLRQLQNLLADPERVAKENKKLRNATDSLLVETNMHTAFYDPENPTLLLLTTHMNMPSDP